MKKSQLFFLLKNRLERGKKAQTRAQAPPAVPLPLWIRTLDEDPSYLSRFDVKELLSGRVTLLHETGRPGGKDWEHPEKSHLWNFNLHYLEFLIPLAAAYRAGGGEQFYECFRTYVRSWIRDNAAGSGDGWHPYTISLRLTNLWICLDGFGEAAAADTGFLKELNDSMYAQYLHLQKHTERHLLGNHYLENQKALLLGALYFQEKDKYRRYRDLFRGELLQQLLPDGMHEERSPMYHKIVLEDAMRVQKALSQAKPPDCGELPGTLQRMADAMDFLEEGMGRTPLFNDSGDNVARPRESLIAALSEEFGIAPEKREALPDAGYYQISGDGFRLLFDAGKLAPDHMPGHAHCDALSFELSLHGRPVLVNAGTGLYQGKLRPYFRSTAAHNTVTIDGEEQSECWGEHRVAGRITDVKGEYGPGMAGGKLTTFRGKQQARRIVSEPGGLRILDRIPAGSRGQAWFHLAPGLAPERLGQDVRIVNESGAAVLTFSPAASDRVRIHESGQISSYAPEFGRTERIRVLELSWESDGDWHETRIGFTEEDI